MRGNIERSRRFSGNPGEEIDSQTKYEHKNNARGYRSDHYGCCLTTAAREIILKIVMNQLKATLEEATIIV